MKPVAGYEGLYIATPSGDIISMKTNSPLKPFTTNSGYFMVRLYKNKQNTRHYVHRIIARTFHENPLNKPVVNHIDGNKKNNRSSNLEWLTRSENTRHAYVSGLMMPHPQIGSKHGVSKLHENDIPKIRRLYGNGLSLAEIGELYNVTKGTIWKAMHGRTWRHI